ncbi:Tripartite tricarboxylate transporter substrate binding protein [Rubrivivax sp. A210]|uniref:tripartite tricarboxylate transporter substrate binding protein n=1 Tax=Rubrivivax sp. A210 TaxID=2772301 RepID=UPI001917F9CD|nr:tripartite tricarboxylate transporter substrate binding protein [Rubrivivax sp. A210]CAD5372728.1 Tripartite tricarboxylate transporter substrate binding protein [Rubrivivax sp. A210]
MHKRQFLFAALAVAALGTLAQGPARAQGGQPLKIVLATPAGGASDIAARLLAQNMAKSLGRQVLVENKPGGNGVPAMQAVLSAPADGHTLLWAQSSMAGTPLLVKSAPVKSFAEFTPVAPVINLVYGLYVNPRLPVNTVAEFGAHLKANPERLSYGTGVLSEYMVTMHYLQAAGAKALRVPYKGGSQLMPDLISGELQFNFGPLAPALPHVKSGKLRLLATLPERTDLAPGVPALAESGIATDTLPIWNGLVAAPGTPKDVVAGLSQEVNRALADPALRAALEAQGFRVSGGTPQQMGAAIESATAVWRQFIRDHSIPQE